MAGYKRLTKTQSEMLIGRTRDLYLNDGKKPEEIASILKRPESQVRAWIGMILDAEAKKESQIN